MVHKNEVRGEDPMDLKPSSTILCMSLCVSSSGLV